MRIIFFAFAAALMVTAAVVPAIAQAPLEVRGPRPEVVYGGDRHYVTLTFYIGSNDTARMQGILDTLQENNVSQAVFFLQPGFAESHPDLVSAMQQRGYTLLPWASADQYDSSYAPTSFDGILLSDRSVLTRVNKTADVVAFYNLALHSGNSSVIAFTPSVPGQFSYSPAVLEEILEDGGRTLVFTGRSSGAPLATGMTVSPPNATAANTPVGTNTTSSIILGSGTWNMNSLQARYPELVRAIQTGSGLSYLVDTTIIIGEGARLNIDGEEILIASPPPSDRDRRIEIVGDATIANSLISSWNSEAGAPDANPYHQRPFIFVDKGRLDLINSTVAYMGFPLGGFSDERSARAAIMFHDASGFTVANSTIAFNFDGIYARNSSNFQIAGNDIYASTRSGIDIRSGSHDFAISANHVHDNGYEGAMCAECTHVMIAGNTVEHNKEGGVKLYAGTNSSAVDGNTIRFNEKFGIYLKDNSTNNAVRGNIVTESEEGITLTGSSNGNLLESNTVTGSEVAVEMDATSQSNVFRGNSLSKSAAAGLPAAAS